MASKKKKILAITYGAGHVGMLIPVILKLRENPEIEVTTIGLTIAGEALRSSGIPCLGFKDFIESSDTLAIAVGEQMVRDLPASSVSFEESVAYLGLSYVDLEQRIGVQAAKESYKLFGRASFFPTSIVERIFSKISPDLVLTTNSPRAERAALFLANERGIKSVCLNDLFAYNDLDWLARTVPGSAVCVLCDHVKEALTDAGRDPSQIFVTGNPSFDNLAPAPSEAEKYSFRNKLGLEGKKIIFWASQPELEGLIVNGIPSDPQLPRKVDQRLMEIILKQPTWALVIRPHPSEQLDLDELPERVILNNSRSDLPMLLHCCDVLVTFCSTVGIGAAILDKPILTLSMASHSSSVPYEALGISYKVESLESLEEVLDEALRKGPRIKNPFPEPGFAAEKIVQVIRNSFNI